MRRAKQMLERELRARNIEFVRLLDGRYQIEVGGGTAAISLENAARELERDGDPQAIVRLVDAALRCFAPHPHWAEARTRIYWSAERSDHEFGDTLREDVTDTVTRVLVMTDEEESQVTWLTPRHVESWAVSLDEIRDIASRNLDRVLAGKRLNVQRVEGGGALGMIPVHAPHKTWVIFATSFKDFVREDIGWPVLVVIPCRDFAYVIAESDHGLLPRMGKVVQEEFRGSSYPITTEVLRVSDEGISAIGHFPE